MHAWCAAAVGGRKEASPLSRYYMHAYFIPHALAFPPPSLTAYIPVSGAFALTEPSHTSRLFPPTMMHWFLMYCTDLRLDGWGGWK